MKQVAQNYFLSLFQAKQEGDLFSLQQDLFPKVAEPKLQDTQRPFWIKDVKQTLLKPQALMVCMQDFIIKCGP